MTKPGRHTLSGPVSNGPSFSAADNLIEGSSDPELEQSGYIDTIATIPPFPALDRHLRRSFILTFESLALSTTLTRLILDPYLSIAFINSKPT
jgi:hypothetical protein